MAEENLCRFVAFLAQQGLKHRSIKSYLSGLRFTQIQLELGAPSFSTMHRLDYAMTGIKRYQAQAGVSQKPRLPITLSILRQLKQVWLIPAQYQDGIMLWAAATTGFFGLLRTGEFTVPSPTAYDPQVHLSLADVSVDSHSAPSQICLRIKQSKTDPFREGVEVYLGVTGQDVCPVAALLSYLAVRSSTAGPLFILEDGTPLSRPVLVQQLHLALSRAGINHKLYNGHSFRIGAATTAAEQGVEDSLIQTLGRWKSSAYRAYIKIPRQQLAAISRTLASASS